MNLSYVLHLGWIKILSICVVSNVLLSCIDPILTSALDVSHLVETLAHILLTLAGTALALHKMKQEHGK